MDQLHLRWEEMTPREQMVWAAAYCRDAKSAGAASRTADEIVRELRALDIDRDGPAAPEYDAARRNLDLTRDEFQAWYRVQHRIANGASPGFHEATDADCAAAYDRFSTSRADFY